MLEVGDIPMNIGATHNTSSYPQMLIKSLAFPRTAFDNRGLLKQPYADIVFGTLVGYSPPLRYEAKTSRLSQLTVDLQLHLFWTSLTDSNTRHGAYTFLEEQPNRVVEIKYRVKFENSAVTVSLCS